jgi:N12 class adenine-specific DNA methylase
MLKIHEVTRDDGSLEAISLRRRGNELELVRDDESLALPSLALTKVMARFGAPLDPSADLVEVASLELAGGARIRHVRHLARFDVIARDFLVYEAPGAEPLCALATTVAGALEHLARASYE